jgi:hypothetical protein
MHIISLHLVVHAFAATLMWWELNFNIHEPNRAWVSRIQFRSYHIFLSLLHFFTWNISISSSNHRVDPCPIPCIALCLAMNVALAAWRQLVVLMCLVPTAHAPSRDLRWRSPRVRRYMQSAQHDQGSRKDRKQGEKEKNPWEEKWLGHENGKR